MEISGYWPGTTVGDAGPYSANSFADRMGAMSRSGVDFGLAANYNIGVFYQIGNALEPAINGANVDVDTGASLVDGLYHENTAVVSVPIVSPVANPRIDYIVVRKNYQQAVTYTPDAFAPTVPPRTARITVIHGAEGAIPVPPTLTQDTTRTTYWDIPICSIDVSAMGVGSNLVDLREFVGNNFGVSILAADNGIADVIELETTVSDGNGANGLGAAIKFKLEDTAGVTEDAGQLAITWKDATSGSEDSQLELRLESRGSPNLSAVIVAPTTASADGNARGAGSNDLQNSRTAVTDVASGQNCVIAGGHSNEASGNVVAIGGGYLNVASNDYSTIGGGYRNKTNAVYSTIPGGYGAYTDKRGQVTTAGFYFTTRGDAQGTIQVFVGRNVASHTNTTWYDLYINSIDAVDGLLSIPSDTLWNFEILLSGLTSGAAQRWCYSITGSIVNDGGTTTLIASTVTTINESDAAYEAQVVADDANDALLVQVRRNGGSDYDVRWLATLKILELTYPA
ncbi:MAG: hypothetical protein WC449_05205 [Candidatus Paceibacterota bacterium]